MKFLETALDFFEKAIMIICLAAMLLLILVATFSRYLGLVSITWGDEAARYCMVWLALIALSYGYKEDSHLGLSFFVDLFKGKVKMVLDIIRIVLILAFNAIVIVYSIQILANQFTFPQFSPSLRIPMYFLYAAIPLGYTLGSVRFILYFIKRGKAKKEGAT